MAQEATSTDAPEGGQGPTEDGAQGSTPTTPTKAEPKTFDEAYVKSLRRESAAARTELTETKSRLQELLDRDKTEGERLTERLAESERKAAEAATRALRYEVAAEHELGMDAAAFLTGDTRDSMTETAVKLKSLLAEKTPAKPAGGFDGGARERPTEKGTPEQEHNDFLLKVLGRQAE